MIYNKIETNTIIPNAVQIGKWLQVSDETLFVTNKSWFKLHRGTLPIKDIKEIVARRVVKSFLVSIDNEWGDVVSEDELYGLVGAIEKNLEKAGLSKPKFDVDRRPNVKYLIGSSPSFTDAVETAFEGGCLTGFLWVILLIIIWPIFFLLGGIINLILRIFIK